MSYKIIRVLNGVISVASSDGSFFNVPIEEIDFEPKVGDEVQCFRNGEKVIVLKDVATPCNQKETPNPISKNESFSNLQASVEISTFPKTGLQGFEQNTPIGNPLADELVEKKSKAPWVIGIILLLLGFLFICFHLNKNNSGVPQGTRTDSHDGTTYKAVVKGTMTDSRDGKKYKTVKIGSQIWMAENLNYKTMKGSWCYRNKESNCDKYGRLYMWKAAMSACPSGWHLPSKAEFKTLFSSVGGESTAGKMLKSQSGWYDNGNGIDAYGFSALAVGVRNSDGNFRGGDGDVADGFGAHFWSASLYMGAHPYIMFLSSFGESASLSAGSKDEGFSVRCLKD